MSNGIKRMYFAVLSAALLLVIAAFISGNGNKSVRNLLYLEPNEMVRENEYTTSYDFYVQEHGTEGRGIAFFTNHQNVNVYCDDTKVYELQAADSWWGHTTGSVWNFVHVPYGTCNIRIQLEQVYESYAMDNIYIYAGNDREIYCSLLEDSLFAMACSAIIIMIGVALIVIWFVVKKKVAAANGVFYLGVLSVLVGLWTMNETDGAAILFGNRVACSFMAFVLLKLLGPTFVLFCREYINEKRRTVWDIFSRVIVIEAVVTVSLQMLNIMDLKETVISTQIVLVMSVLYSLVISVNAIRENEIRGRVKVYIVSSIVVLLAVIADFVYYFLGDKGADMIGRIGFLIFAAILAKQAANNALKMMEKGKYAAIYEELAITDSLTGLYNRNAYQIDSKKIIDLTGFMIFTFDLNDLKLCNDTKGHAQGDRYIVEAAKMIEQLMGTYGRCYRIGGDEFCVLVRNGLTCPAEALLLKLEMEQVRYNANLEENGYPIRIAAGYALFDAELDDDIEATRGRADTSMYQNKRKIKEAHEEEALA